MGFRHAARVKELHDPYADGGNLALPKVHAQVQFPAP